MKIKKKEIIIYIIILLISLIVFSNYIKVHYANDTYAIYNMGYTEYATRVFLKAGRPFSALLLIVAAKLNIGIETLSVISTVLGVLISCVSVMLIRHIILKFKPSKNNVDDIIVTTIAYCTIFNFMYIEMLYFIETSVLTFGVLMAILSAYMLILSNKHKVIKSFFLLLLAVFSYNGTVGIYIVSVFLISLLSKDDLKKHIKDIFISAILIIIAIGLNFVQIKLVSNYLNVTQSRLSSNIFFNIVYIIINARKCFGWK